MSESFSEFSIIIFVYFTRPSFHGLGLTMKMWTEAKGEEEGIGFIQVGVIFCQTGLGHASCQFQLRKKATTP